MVSFRNCFHSSDVIPQHLASIPLSEWNGIRGDKIDGSIMKATHCNHRDILGRPSIMGTKKMRGPNNNNTLYSPYIPVYKNAWHPSPSRAVLWFMLGKWSFQRFWAFGTVLAESVAVFLDIAKMAEILEVPSAKRLHNYGKSHFFYGKTHYKWPFSIAMWMFTRGCFFQMLSFCS